MRLVRDRFLCFSCRSGIGIGMVLFAVGSQLRAADSMALSPLFRTVSREYRMLDARRAALESE